MFDLPKDAKPCVIVQPYAKKVNCIQGFDWGLRVFLTGYYDSEKKYHGQYKMVYINIECSVNKDMNYKWSEYAPRALTQKNVTVEAFEPDLDDLQTMLPHLKRFKVYSDKMKPTTFSDWLEIIKKVYKVKEFYHNDSYRHEPKPAYNVEIEARKLDHSLTEFIQEIAEQVPEIKDRLANMALWER
jgi:hypothetical protein